MQKFNTASLMETPLTENLESSSHGNSWKLGKLMAHGDGRSQKLIEAWHDIGFQLFLNFLYDRVELFIWLFWSLVESHQFGLCAEEHIVTVKGHRMAMANQIYWLTFSLNIFHLKLWPEKLAHQKWFGWVFPYQNKVLPTALKWKVLIRLKHLGSALVAPRLPSRWPPNFSIEL